MKNTLFNAVVAAAILLTISSCDKPGCTDPNAANYNSSANSNNGTCMYNGQVIFYFNTVFSTTATVSINGQTASFTGYYPSGVPNCGSGNSATFTLPVGSYSYSATTTGGSNYSGTVNITANSCAPILLQ